MKAKEQYSELITFVPAVLLFMLWSYAAVSKIADYNRFVQQMQLAPVPLMKAFGPTLGWFVPLIELILAYLLSKEKLRRLALWLSFGLLLIFEIYISGMLLSGLELPCTCGGLISKLGWRQHLFFNATFMLISLFPFIWERIFPKVYSPRSI
ncbi:MAG: hypothetical protein EOO90_06545 [Pedobacter sp.]|nr:MAG: hypothetical protein EOO90_06545 [Pedobacter sp.]